MLILHYIAIITMIINELLVLARMILAKEAKDRFGSFVDLLLGLNIIAVLIMLL